MTNLSKAIRAVLLVLTASLVTLGVFAMVHGTVEFEGWWDRCMLLILAFLLPAIFYAVTALRGSRACGPIA